MIKLLSPAKVNLFLEVLYKRKDGYHEIESVMQTINLFDSLYFKDARKDISIVSNNPNLPCNSRNIVYKAVELLKKEFGIKKGIKIYLEKRIPIGGGLGGGSSNASTTLMALNKIWKLGLSKIELSFLAARLGSDVPFFIHQGTALVKGRGEKVFPLPVKERFYYVLLVLPLSVPTENIYKNLKFPLTKSPVNANIIVNRLLDKKPSCSQMQDLLYNRLSSVAERIYPTIKTTLEAFREKSPDGVLLSGSGSTIFKLCRSKNEAESLARRLSLPTVREVVVARSLNG